MKCFELTGARVGRRLGPATASATGTGSLSASGRQPAGAGPGAPPSAATLVSQAGTAVDRRLGIGLGEPRLVRTEAIVQ